MKTTGEVKRRGIINIRSMPQQATRRTLRDSTRPVVAHDAQKEMIPTKYGAHPGQRGGTKAHIMHFGTNAGRGCAGKREGDEAGTSPPTPERTPEIVRGSGGHESGRVSHMLC